MRHPLSVVLLFAATTLVACAPEEAAPPSEPTEAELDIAPPLPSWSWDPGIVFPADRSLHRPEDGEILPDGRLIVADQIDGLRLVNADGTSRRFGRFAEAGYQHEPPDIIGGPNGVTIEPSGTHLLVADVYRGGLYRVEIATEATEKIYQHPFGINVARRDGSGGIWFTQSTENRPEHGEEELFQSVDTATSDGALFYLPPADAGTEPEARRVVEGLVFANGIVLDEENGHLYLAETMGGRVWRYRLDVAAGRVSEPTVVLEDVHPDNLELDEHGRLWIANPLRNEIVVLDPATGESTSAFRISTAEGEATQTEADERMAAGESWLELFGPTMWEPAPGAMTGVVLAPDEGTVYVTGLGDALMMLER